MTIAPGTRRAQITVGWSAAILIVGLMMAFGTPTGLAEPRCPAIASTATQLIVVTADDANAATASLSTYQRTSGDGIWQRRDPVEPAVIGLKGLAWGVGFGAAGEPRKREGDQRTPAGLYAMGPAFGTAPASRPGYLRLEADKTFCVDDPASPHYNRIVTTAVAGRASGERMWSVPLYRRGLVVDYPPAADQRAGSCIFVHVWRQPGQGTAGCVALPEPSVARLQDWIEPGRAAIALIARRDMPRFADCLPGVAAK
jgi:L,D-peptidoglycan transpeptidase YkuD (ErfK/YbiS/YcfS/YnhG family)